MKKPAASSTRLAILGQLALRKWSAYQLTKSMGRTISWFWPRAESVIYAEARRLVDEGLATMHEEEAGESRTRAVYAITRDGRRALAEWLATEPETLQLELEPLLRLHLLRFGTLDDFRRVLDWTERRADQLLDVAEEVAREFAADTHLFQRDVHFRALLFSALWSIGLALRDWARASRKEIARWDDVDANDAARAHAVRAMQRAIRSR
jgi:DNA-binding PadR family transcriptional regulator